MNSMTQKISLLLGRAFYLFKLSTWDELAKEVNMKYLFHSPLMPPIRLSVFGQSGRALHIETRFLNSLKGSSIIELLVLICGVNCVVIMLTIYHKILNTGTYKYEQTV